jgi:hypothetical protein
MRRLLAMTMIAAGLAVAPAASASAVEPSDGCAELNNPIHDQQDTSIGTQLNGLSFDAGDVVTTTSNNHPSNFPFYAELTIAVGGEFNNPIYSMDTPGTLEHTFDGTEDGVAWIVEGFFGSSPVSIEVSCVPAAPADGDGDGVPDADDLCADTNDDPAPARLKHNRSWPAASDTFGCSASQIIAVAGLGKGHTKFGISKGALKDWIASVN